MTEEHGLNPHEPFTEIDFDEMDERLGLKSKESDVEQQKTFGTLLRRVFKILDRGNTQKGVLIRYQALKYLMGYQDQPGLAKQLGVTKAGISKVVRQVSVELGIVHHNMRDNETCAKFSEETKKRHEIRKAMQLNPNLITKA